MENFFSTLKIELVYRNSWRTRDDAETRSSPTSRHLTNGVVKSWRGAESVNAVALTARQKPGTDKAAASSRKRPITCGAAALR
jgi:hypothetical protein